MTDVSIGDADNEGRFIFLFDRDRLRPSGLAAEIVIPPEQLAVAEPEDLKKQFVRSPYAVSFQREKATFILVTLHVIFGSNEEERFPELRGIAEWMRDWAKGSNRFHHNFLTLGDFNIDRQGSAGYEAFVSTGLTVPDVLLGLPRTIFDDPDDPKDDAFYDQIASFSSGGRKLIDLNLRAGGNFDFMPFVYTDTGLTRSSIYFRISDHFTLGRISARGFGQREDFRAASKESMTTQM